MLNIFIYK